MHFYTKQYINRSEDVSSKDNLRDRIEELKKELNLLIESGNDLTSLQVVKISQELDEVLNKYIRYDG